MVNVPQVRTARTQLAIKFIAIALVSVFAGCAIKPPPPRPSPPPPPVAAALPPPVAYVPPPPVYVPPPPAAPVVYSMPLVNNMAEYRRRAARLIMEANAGTVAAGKLQDPLRGIPVVSLQLNADGSIRNLDFLRQSQVAPETNNLAIQAIRRVANFGPIHNLPGPWQFNETFLYNDSLKFQLRTVVEGL
ncbi:MAG: hypothetical protein WB821_12880 [Burkholderiaceae bacterium]